jgi:hypothetical protein
VRVTILSDTAPAMAVSTMPAGHITLHGASEGFGDLKKGTASALILRLSESQVEEFKQGTRSKDGVQLVTGSSPVSSS